MPTLIQRNVSDSCTRNNEWVLNVLFHFMEGVTEDSYINDNHRYAAFGYWLGYHSRLSTHSIENIMFRLHRLNAVNKAERREIKLGYKQAVRALAKLGDSSTHERDLHLIW